MNKIFFYFSIKDGFKKSFKLFNCFNLKKINALLEMTSSNYDALDLDKIPKNPYCSHGS